MLLTDWMAGTANAGGGNLFQTPYSYLSDPCALLILYARTTAGAGGLEMQGRYDDAVGRRYRPAKCDAVRVKCGEPNRNGRYELPRRGLFQVAAGTEGVKPVAEGGYNAVRKAAPAARSEAAGIAGAVWPGLLPGGAGVV